MYCGVNALGLPTELSSDYSVINTATGPYSDTGLLLSQCPLLGSERRQRNAWLLDIPLNTHGPQVDEEVCFIVIREVHSLYG